MMYFKELAMNVIESIIMNALRAALSIKLSLSNPYVIKDQFRCLNTSNPSVQVNLIEKMQINYDSYILRFKLPTQKCLGTSIGQYIELFYQDNSRKYVPISKIDDAGVVDLLVRDMQKTNGEKSFTAKLLQMQINDQAEIKGPFSQFLYRGYGKFEDPQTSQIKKYKHIGVIVEETGITTAYQLIDSLMPNYDNQTAISLLWVGSKMQDFVFLEEFSMLAEQLKLNFNLMLSENEKSWVGPYGQINEGHISDFMPKPAEDTIIILSGGLTWIDHLSNLLSKMEYKNFILPLQK